MLNIAHEHSDAKGQRKHGRILSLPELPVACLAVGLTSSMVLARIMHRPSRRTMPHLRTFQRGLAASHGEVAAAVLAARIQACYDAYYATRPRFEAPALRWHLNYQILPGLALYQILRDNAIKQGHAPSTALKETGAILERMDVFARWLPLLRNQPFAFAIFRRIGKLSLALFPAKGWDIQMVEDSPERFAFTIRRCFYLDVLTAYGAPELTEHFCRLDDVAYAALPPSIKWERTTTLGRGGSFCDFCWRAADAKSPRLAEKEVQETLGSSGATR
jgi:L-2-amino-thiazoline-4-carboxylic acid hydrolase